MSDTATNHSLETTPDAAFSFDDAPRLGAPAAPRPAPTGQAPNLPSPTEFVPNLPTTTPPAPTGQTPNLPTTTPPTTPTPNLPSAAPLAPTGDAPELPLVSPVLAPEAAPTLPPEAPNHASTTTESGPETADEADEPRHPMAHLMPQRSKPTEASIRAAEIRAAQKAKGKKIKVGIAVGSLVFTALVGPPLFTWLSNAINEAGDTSTEETTD